jgi:WD40 repeat protein
MGAAHLKPIAWQKVHVFISSTFNDMHADRDYLVKRVFPELEDWCERRKLRLVDIDLRWGVTEQDATHNQNVVKVCLNRIDDCRPFFLCLLGQRRGWIPKENEVSAETFAAFPDLRSVVGVASVTEMEILHAVLNPLHQSLLREAAQPAEYYEPAKYAFFYLRDPSYLDELPNDPPQLRETYTNEWIEDAAERKEHDLALEHWREVDIPRSNRPFHLYKAKWDPTAVTPELVLPLQCPSTEPANIERWQRQWQRAGVTVTGLDIEDDSVEASKAREFNSRLSSGRLSDFKCEEGRLRNIIIEELQRAIAERYPDHSEVEHEGELQKEMDQQEQFLFTASEGFIEREGDFAELDGYVESDFNTPFVLTAVGGMGKSTLLANWVDRYRSRIEGRGYHSIHFRFIGQSDGTTTVYSMLRLLLGEIKEVAHKLEEEIPLDPVKLRNSLPELLEAIGKSGRTIIVIDALNQLESGLSDVSWLPLQLPDNIKLIVSFKRGDQPAEKLYERFNESNQVRISGVKPFKNLDDRRRLVRAYLSQYLKELDERHLETLINLRGAENPLYLKVVLSELRVFGAYGNLAAKIRSDLGDTPVSAFVQVLERLENDPAYSPIDPKQAVPLLFGLLAHARRGLSADELKRLFIQALGLEETNESREAAADTINLFLRQVRSFLARRDGRYDFFFESFKAAAQQRYVAEGDEETTSKRSYQEWHLLLARYFKGLPNWHKPTSSSEAGPARQPTWRKVAELPHHLIKAEQWPDLEETLCDLDFIEAKCAAAMTYELVGDYGATLDGLPEAQEEKQQEHGLDEGISRYTQELITHARAWNEARDCHAADPARNPLPQAGDIRFPEFPLSVRPWTEAEIDADVQRIINNPTRLERLKAFAQFVSSESHNLSLFSSTPFFCAQQAYNNYDAGPVGKAAERFIGTGSFNGVLLLHNALTRISYNPHPALLRTLAGHKGRVKTVALSAEGRCAVSGSEDRYTPYPKPSAVRVWDVGTGVCLRELHGHSDRVYGISITLDGRRAVSASGDNTLRVWDIEGAQCLRILQGHSSSVNAVGLTADGRRAISVSSDRTLRVWDVETGECIRILDAGEHTPSTVALTADGLQAVSGDYGGKLRIWNLATGTCIGILEGSSNCINSVAVTADGRRAISGGGDFRDKDPVRVWDLQTAECLWTLEGHLHGVSCVALSADGRFAVSASYDTTLRVWDLERGQCLRVLREGTGWIHAVSLSADARVAVSGNEDMSLGVWNVETGRCNAPPARHEDKVNVISLRPDGRLAVSGGGNVLGNEDYALRIWNMATEQCIHTLKGHNSEVHVILFCPDGNRVVSGGYDANLRLWSLETGQCLRIFQDHRGSVIAAAITPDGARMVSGGGDMIRRDFALRTWDIDTGRCLAVLEGHTGCVGSISLTPDGRWGVSGVAALTDKSLRDKTLRVWDVSTGRCLQVLEGHQDCAEALVLSPDGRLAVSGSGDKTLRVWNLETGECLSILDGHDSSIICTSASPDGRTAISGSLDGTIRVWNLKSGQCSQTLAGHSHRIHSVSFSGDGRFIVSGSEDKTIRVWDAKTGQCQALCAHSGAIRVIALRNNLLAVGDESGGVTFLETRNLSVTEAILTPRRIFLHDKDDWAYELTSDCYWCGKRFPLPADVLDAITSITKDSHISPDKSPCLELSDMAWDEPQLLSQCPHCHERLRFNPFIVDHRERS